MLERRAFLKTVAAAAPLAGVRGEDAKPRAPRLLSGCCAYSYRTYLEKSRMSMEDFIVKAADLGVLGVEITAYWLKSTEPAYLAGLRNLCFRQGMGVAGVACGAQMCERDASARRQTVEVIMKWVDAAQLLGAPHVRVFGDKLPPGATEAQGVEWVAETMKAAAEYAGRKGIVLGIETHTGLTIRASNVIEILRRVDSPFAGCNLDVSNWQENPYEQTAACVPYATSAHIRDIWGERREPLDLDRVWRLFAAQGYRGYLCAEYEGDEDPMTGVPKLVDKMKALCRKYSSA
jgi:sugar phosphate isomerase/epimerase